MRTVMQTEEFKVRNVKCGGCVNNIRSGLLTLSGVQDVVVAIDGGKVIVRGEDLSRAAVAEKLSQLGYPEAA